eukprot:TRINITY_DN48597_c0_g1_i1.p1 TRINITY_DN48597_c0_g1~~TRINITY_DN48597_c0_g1_i1.p1  ORF type:complete len:353 (+),score=43.37 TRINITY_DN48597_c0_g1_i1:110-1168(+)
MGAFHGKRFAWASIASASVGLAFWLLRRRRQSLQRWSGWGKSSYTCMPHVSAASKASAEQTILRPEDVVVITFPKTGTTWLQQTCEQLRTGGDMTFAEITERQPWLDFAWDCGQDLNSDQIANPRIFKSHQLLSAINTGAKYLSIIRNPEAVLLLWFAFQKAKGRPIFVDCADANDYARTRHFEGHNIFGTNVWEYYVELWEASMEANVLVLCYESLISNQSAYLPAIADFIGVSADAKLLHTVSAMTSKEFMSKHDGQFDDNFITRMGRELGRAVKVLEPAAKVTTGHKTKITDATKVWLQSNWASIVTPRTGFACYEDMARAITALSGKTIDMASLREFLRVHRVMMIQA